MNTKPNTEPKTKPNPHPYSRYVIGDIQGCADALARLLAQLEPDAQLWFCGDLINRGADNLGVLRQIHALGARARVVLGNHDIHTLAVACGARTLGQGDTIEDILHAPDAAYWLTWLRNQPLAQWEAGCLMIHAGVLPQWTRADVLRLAAEASAFLRTADAAQMQQVFGNSPNQWHEGLQGFERLRVIINALTRMRLCSETGAMDFAFKGELVDAPAGLLPWFAVPKRKTVDTPIYAGHWSALGLYRGEAVTLVDTGCVWGGALTAVNLDTGAVTAVRSESF